jgi:hypothetical protein
MAPTTRGYERDIGLELVSLEECTHE